MPPSVWDQIKSQNDPKSVWASLQPGGDQPLIADTPKPPAPDAGSTPYDLALNTRIGRDDDQTQAMQPAAPSAPALKLRTDTDDNAPLAQQIAVHQSRLNKIEQPQTAWHDLGTGGKIARVFSTMGNIAGNIVAPDVMASIPGTMLNKQLIEHNLNEQLDKELAQQQARANALAQPKETPYQRPYTLPTDEGMLQYDPDSKQWVPIKVDGETAMQPTREETEPSLRGGIQGTSGGKPAFATFNPKSGAYTDIHGNPLPDFVPADKAMQGALGSYAPVKLLTSLLQTAYNDNPALLPVLKPLAEKIMAQYGGGAAAADVMSQAPSGQPQGSQGQPIGLRMPEAPTGATRTRGQFAGELIPTIANASREIDSLGNELGPFAGRYSTLLTSKIGAYGPKFSGLQSDMNNIATGWGRAHGNSEKVMEEFRQDLDSSKDPQNLKEKLAHYAQQAEIYKNVGAGKPAEAPFAVPEGAPAAPKENDKVLKQDGKVVARSQGGKWVAP